MTYFQLVSFRAKLALGLLLIGVSLVAVLIGLVWVVLWGLDSIPWWIWIVKSAVFIIGIGLVIWDRLEYNNEIIIVKRGLPHMGRITEVEDGTWMPMLLPYRGVTISYRDREGSEQSLKRKLIATPPIKLLQPGDRVDVKLDVNNPAKAVVPSLLVQPDNIHY